MPLALSAKLARRPEGLAHTSALEFALARSNAAVFGWAASALIAVSALLTLLAGLFGDAGALRLVTFVLLAVCATVVCASRCGDADENPLRAWFSSGADRRRLLMAEEPRRVREHARRFERALPHDEFAFAVEQVNVSTRLMVLRYSPVPSDADYDAGFGRRRYVVSVHHQEWVDDPEELVDGAERRARLQELAVTKETEALEFAQWVVDTGRELQLRGIQASGTVRALGGHA